MLSTSLFSPKTLPRDLLSSVVVFLVALPLWLGVAVASGADPIAGVLSGIIGGVLVGTLSKSQTSVSGPAAGLIAIVIVQLETLGVRGFALAVVIAGVMQIGLGLAQAGNLAKFFPTSVIKGLLAAIGITLILKQIPHLLGHDADPEGEMSFFQPDGQNTFSEIFHILDDFHLGALTIGLLSAALLIAWGRIKLFKNSGVPGPLVAVVFGVLLNMAFAQFGSNWVVAGEHLVKVPLIETFADFITSSEGVKRTPDFSQWLNPAIYLGALTIALVASLETLLNLEAVDNLDPKKRNSPPSRELVAQGFGNLAAGFVGALPVTSVIIRSSVNIHSGGQTKLSTIFHGCLLLLCVLFLPGLLNMIPLSCLAAILVLTGFKLASPQVMQRMWSEGRYQFTPFVVTVVAILFTDLLVGVLIGLAVAISFILNSNLRRPIRRFMEKHVGGDVLRIELSEQVSFLKRAALVEVLDGVPAGGHVLIDAAGTDYIDPDVLQLIREYQAVTAPARGVQVSLKGFRTRYKIEDQFQYVDYATRDLQEAITPTQVLEILVAGHRRFQNGERLNRDHALQVDGSAAGEHPLAVVLSCIDSRTPAELIFDVGVGDIFNARIAGNVTSRKVLGSLEYACSVAGAKLILVMGHTRCGAVTAAVEYVGQPSPAAKPNGGEHMLPILEEIRASIDSQTARRLPEMSNVQRNDFVDQVSRDNVLCVAERIVAQSSTLAAMVADERVAIVGAMYDVVSGDLQILEDVREQGRKAACESLV